MVERDRRSVRAQRDSGPVPGEHIKGRGRTITFGLSGEGLPPSTSKRFINGYETALRSERAYQGGVLDPMEF